jgi:hypothetical protein
VVELQENQWVGQDRRKHQKKFVPWLLKCAKLKNKFGNQSSVQSIGKQEFVKNMKII